MEMAGVPKAVHGAFIRGSPVDVNPNGAGPVAAGTKITGVSLNISVIRALDAAISRFASSYRSTGILSPSRTKVATSASREPYSLNRSSWNRAPS